MISIRYIDELAGIESERKAIRALERTAFVFLVLMVISAPHSIAATQTAWLIGMLATAIRLCIAPRPKRKWSLLYYLLFAFVGWTVLSSFLSYDPVVSLDKLRGVGVFLIFFFVIYNVRKLRTVHFLAVILLVSCMVNTIMTPIQRLIGRGVEIHGLKADSPLAKALLWEGDALLSANGKKLKTPDDLAAVIDANETTKVTFYRPDFEFSVNVERADMLPGNSAEARLGFESWKRSHNWRSQGFFGHYVTYAEQLQLLASQMFGLLIAALLKRKWSGRPSKTVTVGLLFAGLCSISLALLVTVTRASQLAFIISAGLIVLKGAGRKWAIGGILVLLPVIVGGLIFLQQSRQVGFFDASDDSTKYRLTMWSDGTRIATDGPRNFIFGVGMDSVKKYWLEWDMFDGGRMAMGHFHSTPIQLLVERGLPALLLWLAILGAYLRSLWLGLSIVDRDDWLTRGVMLGCLGGGVGFFASGFVHYNLGDSEVSMAFYLLMGLGVRSVEFINSNKSRSRIS